MDEPIPLKQPSAVVTAVREKYDQIRRSLPQIELDAQKTLQASREATQRLTELKDQILVLEKFLESQADEAPAPKEPEVESGAGIRAGEQALPTRAANLQIILCTQRLLSDGMPRSTHLILAELKKQGVVFAASNPMQRLSQMLSENDKFINDRQSGWSLKGEDPGATGSSGATKSALDEP